MTGGRRRKLLAPVVDAAETQFSSLRGDFCYFVVVFCLRALFLFVFGMVPVNVGVRNYNGRLSRSGSEIGNTWNRHCAGIIPIIFGSEECGCSGIHRFGRKKQKIVNFLPNFHVLKVDAPITKIAAVVYLPCANICRLLEVNLPTTYIGGIDSR